MQTGPSLSRSSRATPTGMFSGLPPAQPDSLMRLGQFLKDDPRPNKIDLGVGTYRDEFGKIPILRVVKAAEQRLVETQASKGYLGPLGDPEFGAGLQRAFFPSLTAAAAGAVAHCQTPGGTGALRLALDIVAQARPQAQVWLGAPSWPAHAPLIRAAGLSLRTYRHLDEAGELDAEALSTALEEALPGDVILLHGCCHNPTGVDLTPMLWRVVAREAEAKGVVPLVDLAYPGLGDGVEADVQGTRTVLDTCETALVALSCSKSFGLYRDRTGLLLGRLPNRPTAERFQATAAATARVLWSNPPDHGAAAVRMVLESEDLRAAWRAELDEMRARVHALRAELADLPLRRLDLSTLRRQRGMFACLPVTPDEVSHLREAHGVYVDESGRINVAGLNVGNAAAFATALADLDGRNPPKG